MMLAFLCAVFILLFTGCITLSHVHSLMPPYASPAYEIQFTVCSIIGLLGYSMAIITGVHLSG